MIRNLLEAYAMAIKSGDTGLADKLAEIIVAAKEKTEIVTIPVYPIQPQPYEPWNPWDNRPWITWSTTTGGMPQ